MARVPKPVWLAAAMSVTLVLNSPWAAQAASDTTDEVAGDASPDDCLTWTRHDAPALLGENASPAAVASMPEGTIIVGGMTRQPGGAMAWTSTDGATWEPTRLPGGDGATATGVAVVDDVVYAVGIRQPSRGTPARSGLVWRSDDGRVWSQPVVIPDALVYGVVDVPNGVASAGATQQRLTRPSTPTVWMSEGGLDWVPTRVGEPGFLEGPLVVSPDGTWMHITTQSRRGKSTLHIWRSVDGAQWDEVSIPDDLRDASVHLTPYGDARYGPTGFIVAAETGDSGGGIWLSSDATEWRRVFDSPQALASLAEGPCGLLAFTNPGVNEQLRFKKTDPLIHVTPDGATWASFTDETFSGAAVMDAAMAPDGRMVAVGAEDLLQHRVIWVGEPASPMGEEATDGSSPAADAD